MMKLNNLPEEILLEIFLALQRRSSRDVIDGYLHETVQPFRALSLVNWKFRRIAVQFLYSEFTRCFNRSSKDFLSSLLRNPEYGRFVQIVDDEERTAQDVTQWKMGTHYSPLLDKPVRTGIKKKILELELPDLANWTRILKGRPRTGWDVDEVRNLELALLICLCPNLEVLSICHDSGYLDDDEEYLLEMRLAGKTPLCFVPLIYAAKGVSYGLVHTFEHLHTVTLSISKFRFKTVAPILKLRALRTLTIHGLGYGFDNENTEDPSLWDCGHGESMVETLKFHYSTAPSSVIAAIILRCSALKSFCYNFEQYSQSDSIEPEYFCQIFAALKVHRQTLERLDMSDPPFFEGSISSAHRLPSFRDFTNLKQLCLPFGLVVGPARVNEEGDFFYPLLSDRLPSSITALEVSIVESLEKDLIHHFMMLSSQGEENTPPEPARPRFPDLSSIHIAIRLRDEALVEYIDFLHFLKELSLLKHIFIHDDVHYEYVIDGSCSNIARSTGLKLYLRDLGILPEEHEGHLIWPT